MESYVTPILLSYVDKYVRDFKPADVQVSLWGGGVTLHNLVLKPDVLQREVALPFTLVSGRIHELLISVPWTKITSEPIEVTINTIECVLSLNPPNPGDDNGQVQAQARNQLVPSPPRYMQSLIRRVVSNISVTIQSLIVKYVQDDIVLSLNIKWLYIDSADADWNPAFADIDANEPVVRRLVRLDDFTLCLDRADNDGRIRHYQEPLLDRCQLDIRILTTLVSLQNRKAKNLTVQIRSDNLEMGVTSEQLVLLLRLLRERPPPAPPGQPPANHPPPATPSTSCTEVPRTETWSEWAWSWLPSWSERAGAGEDFAPPRPFPVLFSTFLDKVAFVFKGMETEASSGRRFARPLLELAAAHVAVTYLARAPTLIRVNAGARALQLVSRGKCVCGHIDLYASQDKPTPYLVTDNPMESNFIWPEETLRSYTVEPALAEAEEKEKEDFPDLEINQDSHDEEEVDVSESDEDENRVYLRRRKQEDKRQLNRKPLRDRFWFDMAPAIYVQFEHDRSPLTDICPYENPPLNFENSDWKERQLIRVCLRPMTVHAGAGLLHRVEILHELLQDLPRIDEPEMVPRPLTVEECDALIANIPGRQIDLLVEKFAVHFTPWDHFLNETPVAPKVTLETSVDNIKLTLNGPLYSRRVCLAAREIQEVDHPIRIAAYYQFGLDVYNIHVFLSTPTYRHDIPMFEGTVTWYGSVLPHKHMYRERSTTHLNGDFNIPLANSYTTPQSLKVISELLYSLSLDRASAMLRETSLVEDLEKEKDTVALDCEIRRGYVSFTLLENLTMAHVTIFNFRITAVELKNGSENNIGWVFSGPDYIRNVVPFLTVRVHVTAEQAGGAALDYVEVETDRAAANLDPLFMRWLTYRPHLKPQPKPTSKTNIIKSIPSAKYFKPRRGTPPASSVRGGRAGSASEFVHGRTRSAESVSERREPPPDPSKGMRTQGRVWDGEQLVRLYGRLRRTLVRVKTGVLLLYNTSSTASAAGTRTLHEAMERHATELHRVLVFSLGKWVVTTAANHMWEFVNERGPTFLPPRLRIEQSFPWKIKIVGLSSFTLESCPPTQLTDHDRELVRMYSQSRTVIGPMPRTLLRLLESTIIISIVTKRADNDQPPNRPKPKRPSPTKDDQKKKYFTAGMDFKPTTLKDFLRGPGKRPGSPERPQDNPPNPPEPPPEGPDSDGPLASLGIHIHADTPPVHIEVTQDQIHTIRAAFHCIAHIIALLRRPNTPVPSPKTRIERPSSAPLFRSGTEVRSSSEGTPSENISEQLIPIYQTRAAQDTSKQLKTLIWVQWVVNRAAISFLNNGTKLTLMLEDSIMTIDLQEAYEQFRLKIASCTIYHLKVEAADWVPGVLGGRVLETRETADGKHINFFTCAVTRARVSNLPASWKEEYIPKAHRSHQKREGIWEVTVKTAPLEVMLHPDVLRALTLVGKTLILTSFCPVPLEKTASPLSMPVCHFKLGGVRLVLSAGEYDGVQDDTLIFNIGTIITRPHPQNPICRRAISALGEAGWVPATSGGDGRQHELVVKDVGVRSARIREMLARSKALRSRSERTVNPAANWAEPPPAVHITPILHNMDVHGVFAPPLFSAATLVCGPALELNVPADVTVELSAEQVALLARLLPAMHRACTQRNNATRTTLDTPTWCPLSTLYVFDDDPDEDELPPDEVGVSDSGVESQPSTSKMDPASEHKKSNSVSSLTQTLNPLEYLEVFMMMGRIDVAFYVRDDPTSAVIASLRASDVMPRPPPHEKLDNDEERAKVTIVINTKEDNGKELEPDSVAGSKSLTETAREVDVGRSRLEIFEEVQFARRFPKFIPVLHATLSQPNMYYWRKKAVKGLQMSLFNVWVAHGEGQEAGAWHAPLVSTREGQRDPDTEIPPSLASVHFDTLPGSATGPPRDTWSVRIEFDRPILIDLHRESVRRLRITSTLIACALTGDVKLKPLPESKMPLINLLYKEAVRKGITQVTVRTCQMGLQTEGVSVGWEALSAQLATARRPLRLTVRALLTALTVTTHAPEEPPKQHVAVQPLTIGVQAEAVWEAWRGERVLTVRPTVRAALDLAHLAVDVRPEDVDVLLTAIRNFSECIVEDMKMEQENNASDSGSQTSVKGKKPSPPEGTEDNCAGDVFYKDDLRSGAFKIICGEEARPPMAYEVALLGSTVVWHYPVPRSILRLVVYPLPDCDEEVECVLESLNRNSERWETNAYFKIPVSESREYRLTRIHADKVFANVWRVRLTSSQEKEANDAAFEFNSEKYLPQDIPVVQLGACVEIADERRAALSAEQLAGALRVDSFLAARRTPRLYVAVKCGAVALHAHNSLPPDETVMEVTPGMSGWEGVYVSSGQRRAHRVLSATAQNAVLNLTTSDVHNMLSLEGLVGVDIYESETGTMEPLVGDFRLQAVVSQVRKLRVRVCAGDIRVYLNGPRMRTLSTMIDDWKQVFEQLTNSEPHLSYADPVCVGERADPTATQFKRARARLTDACRALEGRVYLYVVNTCDVPLRLGQEGTDELLTITANTTLAYRWNSPLAPKKLRFSSTNVSADWHWSNSVPFTEGSHKVRLEEAGECSRHTATYLYVRVEDLGGRKNMTLSGKVLLGNMLKDELSYKVRVREPGGEAADGMRTVSRGELPPDSVGHTVLDANCATDTYIKIKFSSQEYGWTGDIPLKPCPKAHVPWLVKVPLTTGEVPCVSVWCRVERTRKDERVTVLFFPMFLMRSHLPLDVNVSMTTEQMEGDSEPEESMGPLTQQAAGRGAVTQLLAHGTTTVKHTLIFRYRMADCQVTRESVPLHYGMVEKSVFDHYSPSANADDVGDDALRWLLNDIGENKWPYSVVRTHWPSPWKAAALQPRCDVMVKYEAVVVGGGGCGLVVHLMPHALLANATDVTVIVRAAEATPLCRVDPGAVIALPAPIAQKPFYITIQERHESYLSTQLCVCEQELGVYGTLGAGLLAPDRPTHFAVHCNDRVALMTMYYTLHRDISVFGVTSTYILINKLPYDILIAPIVIIDNPQEPPILRPEVYTRIKPTSGGIMFGERITYFWLGGPWSDDLKNVRAFLCIAMPDAERQCEPMHPAVPVQVGGAAMRRSIALRDQLHLSVPVVVNQVQHEGRWLVSVEADPSPQYLVRNLAHEPLALALPLRTVHEPGADNLLVLQECPACKWWAVVEAGQHAYYSTPTHPASGPAAYLVAGRILGEMTPEWGNPFVVKEGEQLVQLQRDLKLKVRIEVFPHSTNIDLLYVDESDLSASDIRHRLATRILRPIHDYPLEQRNVPDNRYLEWSDREPSTSSSMVDDKTKEEEDKKKSSDELPESEEHVPEQHSTVTLAQMDYDSETSLPLVDSEPNMCGAEPLSDWMRCVADSVTLELAHSGSHAPLVRAVAERVALVLISDEKHEHAMITVGDVQIDNPQHSTRQFDFAVVATTSAAPRAPVPFPPLWGTLVADAYFDSRPRASNIVVRTKHVKWSVGGEAYCGSTRPTKQKELCDLDVYLGPISLYIEDVYVKRVSALARLLSPPPAADLSAEEALALRRPLRVHRLHVHPLDLTLTLHTAMRLYIGVDKSPLRMSAFKMENEVTTSELLTHELTVHYLSGAILGAGWVVGGLELLGAPGSLAARLSGARGGVRDVATTAGAAVLRSLSSCAGSLARNLDLLAGDDEHTQRAAIARREIPPTLMAGLFAGMQHFAVNILGAVGGIAHHPVVGLAVGEASGAAALRRGLVGAFAKPLSATADLVAFAGQGLLSQTGWDPDPQQRPVPPPPAPAAWRRDAVRWAFRLQTLRVLYGVDADLDGATVRLVVTDKFLVVAEPSTERIVEMVDFRFCKLISNDARDVELRVTQNGPQDARESSGEENAYRVNSAAMARVARYTGAREASEGRGLRLRTARDGPALAAAIAVAVRQNQPTHFAFL